MTLRGKLDDTFTNASVLTKEVPKLMTTCMNLPNPVSKAQKMFGKAANPVAEVGSALLWRLMPLMSAFMSSLTLMNEDRYYEYGVVMGEALCRFIDI